MENTWENISLTAGAGTIFIIIYSQTQTLNSNDATNRNQEKALFVLLFSNINCCICINLKTKRLFILQNPDACTITNIARL